VNPPAVVVKKPNPKNIQNADKIKELEEQIQRYVARRVVKGHIITLEKQVAKGKAFPE
jgi:hypothetical protein